MSDYCTAEDVRTFTRDPEMDLGVLALLVPAVSRAVDRHCRRTFYLEEAGAVYDFPRSRDGSIRLNRDLYSLTALATNAGQTFVAADCALTPQGGPPFARIRIKSGTGLLRYSGSPDGAITVTGQWGYSPIAPPDIRVGTAIWVADLYMTSDMRGLSGISADAVGAQLAERLDTPPKDALPFLERRQLKIRMI